MATQISTNQVKNHTATLLAKAASTDKYFPESEQGNLQGFIYHPTGYPIECRRIWFETKATADDDQQGTIGLCFDSEKYIKPGITLEISITLRGETQKFRGKVVLVKSQGERYGIGLWLSSRADAARIRIVEQICHIEAYLQHKRYREGPFISRERVTEEWISRFAASFPSL